MTGTDIGIGQVRMANKHIEGLRKSYIAHVLHSSEIRLQS